MPPFSFHRPRMVRTPQYAARQCPLRMPCLLCMPCNAAARGRVTAIALAAMMCFGVFVRPVWADDPWGVASVPEAWRKAPSGRYAPGGFRMWYRCLVVVPEAWKGRDLSLFVEGVDDAREVYFNGHRIGALGKFPPKYHSGLGTSRRFPIDGARVHYGRPNWIAIRVCHRDGRLGFNVAAPVLFGPPHAIRLEGNWQVRTGDNVDWAVGGDRPPGGVRFEKVIDAASAEKTLRKLSDDEGPFSPEETLRRITTPSDLAVDVVLSEPTIAQPLSVKFDERGRLWLMEYRQYPNPAGLRPVSRDKHLRTVYDKLPQPPPRHTPGRDRISIHEDTDGDGRYDRHTIFVEGLNIATSFARGRDGVWVLNPPYLLFYPDRDHDDRPDGPPEVHLEGFGIEDTHSVANSLTWGPDGWLYGAQGSTVSGNIRRPGSSDPPVRTMGQLIWRYHPSSRRYEVFAEGGGNAFGLEIDAQGRIFSGHNGGNTRGFHYIQGGYFQKGFGKHGALSNRYAFGYFQQMPHPNVPRFTHDFAIYEAEALPPRYRGRIFAVAPLQSQVIISARQPFGSTFKTVDEGMALSSRDTWVRPVEVACGLDGAIYVCDFYEQRIDHAAHFQGRVDRTNGRVYRIRSRAAPPPKPFRLDRLTSEALVDALQHPNRSVRFAALQQIAFRRDAAVEPLLVERLFGLSTPRALDHLWALHRIGKLDEARTVRALAHHQPHVRVWAVRLACDNGQVNEALGARLVILARDEPNIEVRNQLACSVRRLPPAQALPVLASLLRHAEDVDDRYQPLTLWWLMEHLVTRDRAAALALLDDGALWREPLVERFILERLMRRLVQPGQRRGYMDAAKLLQRAPDKKSSAALLRGFEAAVQGRSMAGVPAPLIEAIARAGGLSLELRIRQGDEGAIREAMAKITSTKTPSAEAVRLIEVMSEVRPDSAKAGLLDVVRGPYDAARRRAALGTLEGYQGSVIAQTVLRIIPTTEGDLRLAAFGLLASRPTWTAMTLEQIVQGKLARGDIPDRFVRRALLHRDASVAADVKRIFGDVEGATTEAMYAQMREFKKVILASDGNPYEGKRLFSEHCGKCHTLFEEGGRIGPDLTPFQRSDLDRILLNVVNPSAEIREGFETHLVYTDDGRTLTGFIEDQDPQVVILKDAEGNRHTLQRESIEEMLQQKRSVMPEKLLDPLTPTQIRDLFAYLRMSQPLP